jgi:hypothetical protein
MTDIRTTSLSFDWEEVEQEPIAAVLGKGAMRLTNGELSCEEVAFVLTGKAIVLRVNTDTDEVLVSLENGLVGGNDGWLPLDQFADMVSRNLGWCWLARNYRGYVDTFTLALDGISPSFSFIGEGSSLRCTRVTPIAA